MCGKEPKTEYAKELDEAVEAVKRSEEWRREYMTLLMRDKEQQKLGKYSEKVAMIRSNNGEVSNETMIKVLRINENDYNRIMYFIDNHPDWDDEDVADAILNEE